MKRLSTIERMVGEGIYLSPKEVAEMLEVEPHRIYWGIKAGTVPAQRVMVAGRPFYQIKLADVPKIELREPGRPKIHDDDTME
jgi:hypothetical protein